MRSDNVYDGPVVTITCADETITATAYHPFWVCKGDFLDERQPNHELKEHEDEGFSLPGRWVNSHELRAGDVLIDATGERRLVERLEQHYDPHFPVSNLTIQIHHTFAVGTQSILVHNTSGSATRHGGIKFDTPIGKYKRRVDGFKHALDPDHVKAALKEKKGGIVKINPKTGIPYDHLTETRNAMKGALQQIKQNKKFLGESGLSPATRRAIELELGELSRLYENAKWILGESASLF